MPARFLYVGHFLGDFAGAPTITFGDKITTYRFLFCFGLLQGSKRPLLENSEKKSEKGFPGPLGRGVRRCWKRYEKCYFSSVFFVFDSFSIFPKGSKRCFPNGVFQIPHLGFRQR